MVFHAHTYKYMARIYPAQKYGKKCNYANFVTIIIPKRNKNLCFSPEPPV